jgi:hypothetical protein
MSSMSAILNSDPHQKTPPNKFRQIQNEKIASHRHPLGYSTMTEPAGLISILTVYETKTVLLLRCFSRKHPERRDHMILSKDCAQAADFFIHSLKDVIICTSGKQAVVEASR